MGIVWDAHGAHVCALGFATPNQLFRAYLSGPSGRQVLHGGAPFITTKWGYYPHLPDPIADTTKVTEIP